MDNPTFDKVRDLSTKFYRELPQALQNELFEALNRGIDILDSEPQMTAYLFAFGKMHQAKLEYAFSKLPKEFLEEPEINIIDYGCGQALGTMCYADFLRENGYTQKVKTITMIEPSEICLKRAALHASAFFSDVGIKTVNKTFDELDEDDIYCDEDTPTLHILSNVLDIWDFDIEEFADLINGQLKGYNQFVCVGPYFNFSDKDDRMDDFISLMDGDEVYCETLDKYEFDSKKAWTAKIGCFSIGELKKENHTKRMMGDEIDYRNIDDLMRVSEDDEINGVEDDYGVVYSKDGKRLLNCKNKHIESYFIKSDTKIICYHAFYECRSLQNIFIPDSVIGIGFCAFKECSSLKQIIIPNSIKVIDDEAFSGCHALQQIIISNAVTNISNGAFEGCHSLQQIIIPNSVININGGAFNECISLRQVIIPNSVTSIGKGAFSRCISLQQITIPNSVTSIGEWAFYGCHALQQIIIPYLVTSIGESAFEGCSSLRQVSIPNSVTNIEKKAFFGCTSLQQVIIPNSVTSIGESTFSKCSSLQRVAIPNSVKCIGSFAFRECSSLQEIIIPDSVEDIGPGAFFDCIIMTLKSNSSRFIIKKGLLIDDKKKRVVSCLVQSTSVVISESVTSIGERAFWRCYSLSHITIPNSVKSIESAAFTKCSSLQQIIIPDSVTSIGDNAFIGCTSLRQIIIPTSVTYIGYSAFSRCTSLQKIIIPASVTHIGGMVFHNDSMLQQIVIPKGSSERFKKMLNKELWDKLIEQ